LGGSGALVAITRRRDLSKSNLVSRPRNPPRRQLQWDAMQARADAANQQSAQNTFAGSRYRVGSSGSSQGSEAPIFHGIFRNPLARNWTTRTAYPRRARIVLGAGLARAASHDSAEPFVRKPLMVNLAGSTEAQAVCLPLNAIDDSYGDGRESAVFSRCRPCFPVPVGRGWGGSYKNSHRRMLVWRLDAQIAPAVAMTSHVCRRRRK
jgi:hypothetical protein